jgi:hypothetical protein
MRKEADLVELYQVFADSQTCLRRAIISAAVPDMEGVDIPECGSCGVCQCRFGRGHKDCKDVTNILKRMLTPEFFNGSTGWTEATLLTKLTRKEIALSAAVARKLVFGCKIFGLLRRMDGRKKMLQLGPHCQVVGPAAEAGIHMWMECSESVPTSNESLSNETEQETALTEEFDENFDVKEIIDSRTRGGLLEYHARFHHGHADEWLSAKDLPNAGEAIQKFEESHPQSARLPISAFEDVPVVLNSWVNNWSFLNYVLVQCLVGMKKISWSDIKNDLQLADELQQNDPKILQRKIGRDFPPGPPPRTDMELTFAASVKLGGDGRLKWEMKWPKIITRREGTVAGLTKRVYEQHGSWNLLSVEIADGGDKGAQVSQLLRKTEGFRVAGRDWLWPKVRVASSTKNRQLIFRAKKAAAEAGVQLPLCPRSRHAPEDYQAALDRWNEGPLLNSHYDWTVNMTKTISKAVHRANLMHSSITPTVEPDNVVAIPDDPPGLDKVTDGAGDISRNLMAAVYAAYLDRTGEVSDGCVPTALQYRMGSHALKGVASVDPALGDSNTLAFRSTQQKYSEIVDPTAVQRVIEVCKFATDSGSVRLNLEVIRMMEPRLKDPEVLTRLLRHQLEKEMHALDDGTTKTAEWFCRNDGARGEGIWDKISAGFALESELVQGLLKKAMRERAEAAFAEEKLYITVPESRRLILIPDKPGLMREDEVMLRVPRHPGISRALLARNPCKWPGEILDCPSVRPEECARRALPDEAKYQAALAWYTEQQCVCIMPALAGCRPMADRMQNGDYDGDDVIAIWQKDIVAGFKPCEPLVYAASELGTPCEPHPLGNMRFDELIDELDIDAGGSSSDKEEDRMEKLSDQVNDKVWEWFDHLVREMPSAGRMSSVARISQAHAAHADICCPVWRWRTRKSAVRRCSYILCVLCSPHTSVTAHFRQDLDSDNTPRSCVAHPRACLVAGSVRRGGPPGRHEGAGALGRARAGRRVLRDDAAPAGGAARGAAAALRV